jgi:pimeloyl-ACP methyl ester carboxylesterase
MRDIPFRIPEQLEPYRRTVSAAGLRLHTYDSSTGVGPPLVLIHGLGDEADTWRHVFLPLAERRRVIALDLPGFGRSDRPRHAYTLAFFAQTIVALLKTLAIERAVLVGSSMGAAVALRLALARPGLVDRLALLDGSLPLDTSRPSSRLALMLAPGVGEAIYTRLRRSQDEAYATLQPYYADLDSLPAEDRAFLRERVWARVWSNGQRRAFFSTLRWLAVDGTRAAEFRERLTRLTVPAQLIWGEADAIVPRAVGDALAALLPLARLDLIPGCGHLPQQERPAELIGLLDEALVRRIGEHA